MTYSLEEGNMRCEGCAVDTEDEEVRLQFRLTNGMTASLHLMPSPDKPVWRSWLTLRNATDVAIGGITRFDAANCGFSTGPRQPECGYVLGWLEGPRVDAPGRHPTPYRYEGWVPKFLYGEGAQPPPPPSGGWQAPVYRLVQERLTRLPLRSGKRSTYDNHPWVTVRDPERRGGWFLGFEWSGTWKIDVEYLAQQRVVTVCACSDANTHVLEPGQELVSPAAFLGLFDGDWDDAFNACRHYVDDEIIPKIEPPWPTALHVYHQHNRPECQSDDFICKEMAAAAAAGFESVKVETIWWSEGLETGEFSIGLGDLADNRTKFPMGLRGMSDYVHSLGMNFGLWFEIERVDIRTCNRLRNPWKPEWLVHRDGHPYRSWCQHAFMLCLGVEAAAEWALENLIWAVNEYGIDYIMFDSNEWAVCNDPTHDHGPGDGEWAQIQGFYRVMEGLRREFPSMMVWNSSGGSQRADFGIARYSNCVHPHDHGPPSAKQRRFMHGTGCMYPQSYQVSHLGVYADEPSDEGFTASQPMPAGHTLSPERFEWRVLNRLMGHFVSALEMGTLPASHRAILERALRFYKALRPCSHGDRYILAGPELLHEPRYEEADNWEAYQYVACGGDLVSVHVFRCLSQDSEYTARLRGLDPEATYQARFYSGRPGMEVRGAELMERGYTWHLDRVRSGEIMILERR